MLILISRDLFFASKVTGTAAALGLKAITVGSVDQIPDDVTGVMLDLNSGVSRADVIAAIPVDRRGKTLAFGPHVDTAALNAATAAGFQTVLPRSRFSAELPRWLQELAAE